MMWPLCRMSSGFSCSKGKSEKAAIEPKNSRRVVPSVMKSFVKSRGSLRMLRCRSANVNAVLVMCCTPKTRIFEGSYIVGAELARPGRRYRTKGLSRRASPRNAHPR